MRQALVEALERARAWEFPIDFNRLPTQTEFIFDFEHRFSAYGGGLGNGKTTGGCTRAALLSLLFPGNTGYMGRYDGKEFRQTTLVEFLRLIPPSFIGKRNDQLGYLKFKDRYGGSEIVYGDLKEERFNNINLGWFYVDQAEEIDESRWNLLVSRLRRQTQLIGEYGAPLTDPSGNLLIAQTYGFATFNPEGTHSYLWRFFHPDSPEHKPGYKLYQASTYDGLAAGFITQEYVDGMLAVFPEQARRRYLDGAWDVFEGRVYPEFAEDTHVLPTDQVRAYLKRTPHTIYESIDHGLMNPTAVGWWAVDIYGNRFLIDEHYEGNGKPVKYHAEIIKAKREQLGQSVAVSYLDSACWARNQTRAENVYAIVDEYNDYKIFPVPGQKDWGSAYTRITQGLRIDPLRVHPINGQLGSPQIFVAAHCQHFIKEALSYRWKKNRITVQRNAPDKPQDLNDHHMDAWAYFEASRPRTPVEHKVVIIDPLQVVRDVRAKYNPLADSAPAGSWMSY